MTQLLTSLLAQREPASAGPSLSDLTAVMREARESAQGNQTPAEAMRELVTLGIDLASRGSTGGDDEGTMFEKYAPRVMDLLTALVAKPGNGEPAANLGVDADLTAVVRHFAPKIIAEAQQGRDPYLWGSFIAERTPPAFLPHLDYLCKLSPAERHELFARLDTRVLPYMSWLDEAAEGVARTLAGGEPGELGEPDDAEIDSDRPGGAGEGSDVVPHAPVD